jgi:predicted membrane-bound spermidine synthase
LIPWKLLDTAQIPGGGELRLMQRGTEFSIKLGQNELMNSRLSGSEEALATLTCERLQGCKQPRLLIGGLGMGFTLRAALSKLDANARVVVAELAPEVVAWARGPMAEVFGDSLNDPRVSIREKDVGLLIRAERSLLMPSCLMSITAPRTEPRGQRCALQHERTCNGARRVAPGRCTGCMVVRSRSAFHAAPDELDLMSMKSKRAPVAKAVARVM